jgi:hypothetical protein
MSDLFNLTATEASTPNRRKPLSTKQSIIIQALREQPQITLSHAICLIGRNIYHNAPKHVGAVLSNMVKRGQIVRIKPGVFQLPKQ